MGMNVARGRRAIGGGVNARQFPSVTREDCRVTAATDPIQPNTQIEVAARFENQRDGETLSVIRFWANGETIEQFTWQLGPGDDPEFRELFSVQEALGWSASQSGPVVVGADVFVNDQLVAGGECATLQVGQPGTGNGGNGDDDGDQPPQQNNFPIAAIAVPIVLLVAAWWFFG